MTIDAVIASAPSASEAIAESHERKAFGFWLYLMSDAIIFALLFATYVVMSADAEGRQTARSLFSLSHVSGETLLLLCSSLTFGFAALAMHSVKRGAVLWWLLVTFALGLGFLAMEIIEFRGMAQVGAGPDRSGFLSAFFALVGTHGLHVAFGLVWILILASQVIIKGLTPPVTSRLFRLGLFWHFLDIVWVGIFSVVYLPGLL
ncbi:cytochrome o ubiquinol oxidase subunit III [Bradyrhizobium sp. LHD-71]|uniref:cytochrome o ubiquinol oxidase subunit III n=1 Tax=Bradyrhizobium sp. LHD-71 TaxID=3072141 RepID=UPI00280CA608|nr:cytochrome o ubiquinol oxidase subunit III [Bradyrhizobium sp. LHD-71]MDQ8726676.1 cytochrome o ubiquinol oxidase subunit III [Bradyrhizobium sp. LHD-71]